MLLLIYGIPEHVNETSSVLSLLTHHIFLVVLSICLLGLTRGPQTSQNQSDLLHYYYYYYYCLILLFEIYSCCPKSIAHLLLLRTT